MHIADAMFVFDMQNDLPENPYINMDSGYLDCHLVPDVGSGRILTHRPGYALVFADAYDSHGQPHPLAPRNVLAAQIDRCRLRGLSRSWPPSWSSTSAPPSGSQSSSTSSTRR